MPVSPFSIWVSFGLSNSTGRDVGASTAGVARLPYCVFDIFYDVKRDDIRMDISCDVFGNRRDHRKHTLAMLAGMVIIAALRFAVA